MMVRVFKFLRRPFCDHYWEFHHRVERVRTTPELNAIVKTRDVYRCNRCLKRAAYTNKKVYLHNQ